jgi:hypothetical protein
MGHTLCLSARRVALLPSIHRFCRFIEINREWARLPSYSRIATNYSLHLPRKIGSKLCARSIASLSLLLSERSDSDTQREALWCAAKKDALMRDHLIHLSWPNCDSLKISTSTSTLSAFIIFNLVHLILSKTYIYSFNLEYCTFRYHI